MADRFLSVVIPTYNRERFVADALDSVFNQELPKGWKLDVVVADDGSTDGTVKILKSYGEKIRLLELPHSGKPAVPRNAALKVAKGDIIAFQDSDDLWAPNKLLLQLPLFENSSTILSFGQAETMDSHGKLLGGKVVDEKTLAKKLTFADLLKQNCVSTLTAMTRKSAILAAGGFDESDSMRAVEDYNLWLKIAALYPKGIRSLQDTLAHYRIHDNNISKANSAQALRKIIAVLTDIADFKPLKGKDKEQAEEQLIEAEENLARQLNEDEKAPAVSVLMSVYNGEKFLRPAIESILNQTYKDFEFLIINDGSKDSSQEIIESYKDPRIRLINQENHGFIYSLNKGVRIARGEFIARMDQDDLSSPTRFEEELRLLNKNPRMGAVSTYFEFIDFEDGKPLGKVAAFPIKSIDLRRAMYVVNPMAHGATIFRKQAFIEVGPYTKEYAPAEDFDLWRRIARHWDIGMVPKVLFQYRINNPNSMSQSNTVVQEDIAQRIRQEIIDGPFIGKSVAEIVDDYNDIGPKKYGEYADVAREEYLSEQFTLAYSLLISNSPKKALLTTIAVIKIKPSLGPKLLIKYPKCLYINLARRLKLRKT